MAKKTIIYSDPLNDDFAKCALESRPVPADYHFAVTDPFWRVAEFLL